MESKNTSSNHAHYSQYLGFQAELKVIQLLKTQAFDLVFQRLKTKIAEIDLIFEKDDDILLVEVKTLSDSWRAFQRINSKQFLKLHMNLILFTKTFKNKKIKAYVAWVDKKNVITFLSVD